VAAIGVVVEILERKLMIGVLGHWDIRNLGDNLFMYFGIAKLESLMSGSQLSA
jgi:hypothetical protein